MNRSNTSHRSFSTDQLRALLGDIGGPSRPDYLPDIVAQVRRVRQRPAWTLLERWLPVDIAMLPQRVPRATVQLAAVLVLLVVLLGVAVYIGSQRPTPLPADGVLDPGLHSVAVDGYRYTFRVPGLGWKETVVTAAQAKDAHLDLADVELTQGGVSTEPPDLGGFALWGNATQVHRARCQELMGASNDVGPTAHDLATAIASLDGFRSSGPTGVTIGSYRGERLQLAVPADRWAACTEGTYRYAYGSFTDEDFKDREYQGPEQIDDIWILDLDNGHRQLFLITYFPTTPPERIDDLRQMIDSVEISPVVRAQ
jgi:hypothetical protein